MVKVVDSLKAHDNVIRHNVMYEEYISTHLTRTPIRALFLFCFQGL